jgi:hypothetical protein
MSLCHRCGSPLPEGSLKYQVALRVRSMFDGAVAESDVSPPEAELARLLKEVERYSEEELDRQVYEDDIFIMCPACKEAFMDEIYAHILTKMTPEAGRAHLIH